MRLSAHAQAMRVHTLGLSEQAINQHGCHRCVHQHQCGRMCADVANSHIPRLSTHLIVAWHPHHNMSPSHSQHSRVLCNLRNAQGSGERPWRPAAREGGTV